MILYRSHTGASPCTIWRNPCKNLSILAGGEGYVAARGSSTRLIRGSYSSMAQVERQLAVWIEGGMQRDCRPEADGLDMFTSDARTESIKAVIIGSP